MGRAPRTKETLPDFCENMDPDKLDTTLWYRVTRNPQELCGLSTGASGFRVSHVECKGFVTHPLKLGCTYPNCLRFYHVVVYVEALLGCQQFANEYECR